MLTVYNIICNSKVEQEATAREIAAQLNNAMESDLNTACDFFRNFFAARKESAWEDPRQWEDEEGNTYDATESEPDNVWEWLANIHSEEMEYLEQFED